MPFRNIVSRSEQVSESRKTIHLRFTIKKSILSSKNFPIQQNIGRTPEKVSPSFLRFPATLRLLLSFPSNLWLFRPGENYERELEKKDEGEKLWLRQKKWRNENFGKSYPHYEEAWSILHQEWATPSSVEVSNLPNNRNFNQKLCRHSRYFRSIFDLFCLSKSK